MFGIIFEAFILGLLTPLTAVCVLPLFPAFLSYLSSQFSEKSPEENKRLLAVLGTTIVAGIISFMFVLGLLFTLILKASLTQVVQVVSPIAFGVLAVISIFLIFDIDFSKIIPKVQVSSIKQGRPLRNAYVYGFFFGAIVIPCNPAFIAAFFTRAASISASTLVDLLSFISFGVGLGAPLLAFSLLSNVKTDKIITFLTAYKTWINRIAGIIMFIISMYYLFFVFRVLG